MRCFYLPRIGPSCAGAPFDFANSGCGFEGNAFVELVKWCAELPDVSQINVTTRDREAMPLLRYFTGGIIRRTLTVYRILGRDRDLFY